MKTTAKAKSITTKLKKTLACALAFTLVTSLVPAFSLSSQAYAAPPDGYTAVSAIDEAEYDFMMSHSLFSTGRDIAAFYTQKPDEAYDFRSSLTQDEESYLQFIMPFEGELVIKIYDYNDLGFDVSFPDRTARPLDFSELLPRPASEFIPPWDTLMNTDPLGYLVGSLYDGTIPAIDTTCDDIVDIMKDYDGEGRAFDGDTDEYWSTSATIQGGSPAAYNFIKWAGLYAPYADEDTYEPGAEEPESLTPGQYLLVFDYPKDDPNYDEDGANARYLPLDFSEGTPLDQMLMTYETALPITEPEVTSLSISATSAVSPYSIKYQAHVQNIGWQNWTNEGGTAGTTGKSLRMEAISIALVGTELSGSVEYRTHVQNIGWMGWVKDGAVSGTTGRSLRAEAISIRLTGDLANTYDIYYRAHVQNVGWMCWAKNGAIAGSESYSLRMEALEIRLVLKDGPAPGTTNMSYKKPAMSLIAHAHVQNIGWQGWVSEGSTAGTTGQSLRMEALCLSIACPDYAGSVEYRAYVAGVGWQGWKSDGDIAGTTGQSRQMGAIQLRLTGEIATKYDIYYRVHAANIGWMGWVKNGEQAGTASSSYRLEAIQVRLVVKGTDLPSPTVYENPIDAPAMDQCAHGLLTGCEITAAAIMLSGYLDEWVCPVTLANQMPYHGSNPNLGYVGNPFSYSGWTIYPPALVSLVSSYAGSGIDLTGASYDTLRSYIDQGKPVVVWTTMHGFGVHAITLTGYDAGGWYYNDPWTGSKNSWMSQATLNSLWGSQSWRALSI